MSDNGAGEVDSIGVEVVGLSDGPTDGERDWVADIACFEDGVQFLGGGDFLAVYADDDIALFNAHLLSGGALGDTVYINA